MPVTQLPDRAVLAVTGEDRVAYLQGLVSNDVAAARPGHPVWAALLTPQGKWLADFFINAEPDRLLLDVASDQATMLAQRLTRFRLRAKVTMEPAALAVFAGWDMSPLTNACPDPRLPEAGWRLLTATPPASTATPLDYDLHRLRLGLPAPADLEPEKTTLLEAGFDELHGISWTKGCYMGQELTARTKYRGLLKRRLVPVRCEGPLPPPGTPILGNGTEVGTLRSGQAHWAMALLRLDALAAQTLSCGGATLTPAPPAWFSVPAPASS